MITMKITQTTGRSLNLHHFYSLKSYRTMKSGKRWKNGGKRCYHNIGNGVIKNTMIPMWRCTKNPSMFPLLGTCEDVQKPNSVSIAGKTVSLEECNNRTKPTADVCQLPSVYGT